MKYLRKFNTEADVMMFDSPNVVLVADTKNVLYNVPKTQGVYIQHINGAIYTTEAWTAGGFSNEQANGVAVVDDRASFVISKTQIRSPMKWSSDTSNAVEGVLLTESSTVALTDYKGAENTTLIAAISTSGAAYSCVNYVFPNGQKGYLPAYGEWSVAYSYKAAITEAMSLIDGIPIMEESNYHWASTQFSAKQAWNYGWTSGGYYIQNAKSKTYYVRPFTTL